MSSRRNVSLGSGACRSQTTREGMFQKCSISSLWNILLGQSPRLSGLYGVTIALVTRLSFSSAALASTAPNSGIRRAIIVLSRPGIITARKCLEHLAERSLYYIPQAFSRKDRKTGGLYLKPELKTSRCTSTDFR